MAGDVITIENLQIDLSKGGHRFSLEIPALRIKPGDFVAVVGPSGCGKSTLLDVLGLVRKFSHRTKLFNFMGNDAQRMNERQRSRFRREKIGYILQHGGLLPFLTVEKNIRLSQQLRHGRKERESAHRLINQLDIGSERKKLPAYLSGGQRQRAAIARALAHRPAIVLADEPTAAVDPENAQRILAQLRQANAGVNAAIVLVTHDRSLLEIIGSDNLVRLAFEKLESTRSQTRYRVVVRSDQQERSQNIPTPSDSSKEPTASVKPSVLSEAPFLAGLGNDTQQFAAHQVYQARQMIEPSPARGNVAFLAVILRAHHLTLDVWLRINNLPFEWRLPNDQKPTQDRGWVQAPARRDFIAFGSLITEDLRSIKETTLFAEQDNHQRQTIPVKAWKQPDENGLLWHDSQVVAEKGSTFRLNSRSPLNLKTMMQPSLRVTTVLGSNTHSDLVINEEWKRQKSSQNWLRTSFELGMRPRKRTLRNGK